MILPKKLRNKLDERIKNNALRELTQSPALVDFSSNDYLGLAKDTELFQQTLAFLKAHNCMQNGVGGSRLLTGNHPLYPMLETQLTQFYQCQAALVFSSGYTANLGLLSAIVQRGDCVLYDQYCHASIRDGLHLGLGTCFKFKHNDLADLERVLQKHQHKALPAQQMYVLTESIFSMDGDEPDLSAMMDLCDTYHAKLIVDEAHAVGVFGSGLVPLAGICDRVFARVVTFGKGIGAHGAAVLGTADLKSFLVNFARSFIYTTGLNPHTLATLICAHQHIQDSTARKALKENIRYFKAVAAELSLPFISSSSAIQCVVIPGNSRVKAIAEQCRNNGFDIRPILSPTVPEQTERLRFCLHSYNTPSQIQKVLTLLHNYLKIKK